MFVNGFMVLIIFFNSDTIFSIKMLGKDNFLMRRVVQTIKCNTTRLVSYFIDQGYQLFVTAAVIIYGYYNFFGVKLGLGMFICQKLFILKLKDTVLVN